MRRLFLVLVLMTLLASCVTSWQARKSVVVNFAGNSIDCEFVVFYEDGQPLKTVDTCSFEVVVGDNVYKCIVKAPTQGKEVKLDTDCEVLVKIKD